MTIDKDTSFEVTIIETPDLRFIIRRTTDGKQGWLNLLEMDERCVAFDRNSHMHELIGERLLVYAMMETDEGISVSQFSPPERQRRAQEQERWWTKMRAMSHEERLLALKKHSEETKIADQKYLDPYGLKVFSQTNNTNGPKS